MEYEYQVNDEVVMANHVLHDRFPDWYPIAGTVGIVRKVKSKTVLLVQWPSGSTSQEDLWSVQIENITLNMIPSDANSQELDSFLSEF